MATLETLIKKSANRRTFLTTGITAAGAVTMGAGLLGGGLSAFGQDHGEDGDITKGDIAILRFLNALEQIETDLWIQYNELGGIQDNEVPGVNGAIPSTRPPLVFSMATWHSTSTTTPTMRSATPPS
ncbi:MAG: hypothetical protein QOE55_4965 [Acidobacteriaceae bacterium]|jgi:hypothetical protein|nr:hypothetical protein [Acidobacteriaceae bacterium]